MKNLLSKTISIINDELIENSETIDPHFVRIEKRIFR